MERFSWENYKFWSVFCKRFFFSNFLEGLKDNFTELLKILNFNWSIFSKVEKQPVYRPYFDNWNSLLYEIKTETEQFCMTHTFCISFLPLNQNKRSKGVSNKNKWQTEIEIDKMLKNWQTWTKIYFPAILARNVQNFKKGRETGCLIFKQKHITKSTYQVLNR